MRDTVGLAFLIVLFFVTLYMEYLSVIGGLTSISFLLLLLMYLSNRVFDSSRVVSPLLIFSLMYSGYVVGGAYFAQSGEYYGKFLEFSGIELSVVQDSLVYAAFFAFVNFFAFAFGYATVNRRLGGFDKIRLTGVNKFISRTYLYVAPPLLVVGFFHWVIVSYTIAGGIVESLVLFQVFPHLSEQYAVTIVPYLAYYTGIFYILIGRVSSGRSVGFGFWVLSIIGFVISISTARISSSVCYILAQLYFLYLLRPQSRGKIVLALFGIFSFAFVLYFLREASNYYFIGHEYDFNLSLILPALIGGGNVCDLQQLVLVFKAFETRSFLFGTTYFDWIANSFGGLFGFNPASVGLLIADIYVPETSGAPTPGAVGEAYANFGIGAPLLMFGVGACFSILFRRVSNSESALMVFVYSSFSLNFIFLYPKVDSTMFSNFFWSVAPLIMVVYVLYYLYLFLKPVNVQKKWLSSSES